MFCNGLCNICKNPCKGGIFYVTDVVSEEEQKVQENLVICEDKQSEVIENKIEEIGLSVISEEEYEVKKNLFGKLVAKRK